MKCTKIILFGLSIFGNIHISGIQAQDRPIALVIHGGAGDGITEENIPPAEQKVYRKWMEKALDTGYQILENDGSSVDAVVAAITVMEDCPLFNAGRGAVLTQDGRATLDASIMYGADLEAGAVAGVEHIKNPIQGARAVMENSPHVLLAGAGAEVFLKEQDIETVSNEYFITPKRKKQWNRMTKSGKKFGTVGAVALDTKGNLAAGTSTGGIMLKQYGRVGDSPLIGSGTYADNRTCGISSTGQGEYFIRLNVAKEISALMQYRGIGIQEAMDEVIHGELEELGGAGGVIGLDVEGNVGVSFNTEGMFRGWISGPIKKYLLFNK